MVEVTATRDPGPASTFVNGPARTGGTGGVPEGGGGPGRKDPSPAQKDKPASEGNTDPASCSSPATKQPVIIATGEKFKHEQDFSSGNSYGLDLRRTYRSNTTAGKFFGAKWLSTYDFPTLQRTGCYSLPDYPGVCFPTSIVYTDTTGAKFKFTRTASELSYAVSNSSAAGQLIGDGTSWSLYLDDRIHIFSFSGVIQQITDSAGLLLRRFEYLSAGSTRPNRILNRAGQAIQFTWSNSRVTQIVDPGGNAWTYAYDANGMLSTATSAGASPDIKTYHYEDATDRTLLTGISINSVRYSTYAYDSLKRVRESGLAGGEERDTFTYGAGQTTVTSAAGQSITHSFGIYQGGGRSRASRARPRRLAPPPPRRRSTTPTAGWTMSSIGRATRPTIPMTRRAS